jgi:hypothetical protein
MPKDGVPNGGVAMNLLPWNGTEHQAHAGWYRRGCDVYRIGSSMTSAIVLTCGGWLPASLSSR